MKRFEGRNDEYAHFSCGACNYQRFGEVDEPFWKCECDFVFCRLCALTHCLDPVLPLELTRPYCAYELQRLDREMANPRHNNWTCQCRELEQYMDFKPREVLEKDWVCQSQIRGKKLEHYGGYFHVTKSKEEVLE